MAESTTGAGSKFWFTAKLHRGRGVIPTVLNLEKPDVATQLRDLHHGARILLVDDNAINREVANGLLSGLGMTVETAADGRIAVDMVQTRRYNLILMDMQMPVMDGLQATRTIRKLPGWETKPILAMTANALHGDRYACEAAGMNDFISKPVKRAALYEALLLWLSAGRAHNRTLVQSSDAATVPFQAAPIAADTAAAATPAESSNDDAYADALKALALKVPDIDFACGIALLGGDARKYLSLLRQLAASHANDPAQLTHCIGTGDRTRARQLLHTLKGTAGTLGVASVADTTRRLEHLMRTDRDATALPEAVHREVESLDAHLLTLAAALASFTEIALANPASDDEPDQPPAVLNVMLTELEILLAHNDTAAINLLEENEAALRAALGPVFETISHFLNHFDFESARLELKRRLRRE